MERFQLMQQVNAEGLYGTIQASLPYFQQNGWRGRIIVVSPPIYSRFFRGKTAYAMGKVAMSVLTKGMAMDFKREGKKDMAISSIWPASVSHNTKTLNIFSKLIQEQGIQSAATEHSTGGDRRDWADLRKPAIFSDAILAMLNASAETVNGLLELDEDFLRKYTGMTNFSKYSLIPGTTPRRIMPAAFPDLTVAEQDDEGRRVDSTKIKRSKI
jgi:NAD(P)-dependent dehydrogenase (short-subunit alcohol dehydrogenase family)